MAPADNAPYSARGAIRALLSGGDRRSIAQSNRARAEIERNPALVTELAALTDDPGWLVTQRALDLMEKVARDHAARIEPYKNIFHRPLGAERQVGDQAADRSGVAFVPLDSGPGPAR